MKFTTWLKLKKPELTDVADIDVLNENFDKIDEEVNNKVDKIEGKGLSTEDYTSLEKEKLSKIADGAQVNTVTGVKGDNESSYRTGNINITKANVGLGSVPNVTTNNQTPTYTEASSLTALVSGETLATAFGKIKKAISDFISHKGSTSNPHSVTKSQVGLGDVPNVTTNNQTPSYTQASSLAALVSGETLATAFGKIAKAIADLISHINKTSDSSSASALSSSDTNYPTVRDVYYGLPNINGSHSYNSGTNIYAPTNAGTAGYELISNGSGVPIWKAPSYAVCSTAASTAAKTASISNFKLVTGARVCIKFTYNHTSNTPATLNVNSTGAKTIYYKGMAVTKNSYSSANNSWNAGEMVEFVYDGTYWKSIGSDLKNPCVNSRCIVVGRGASHKLDECDYICEYAGDMAVGIQQAIDACPSGGKIILLSGGVYDLSSTLTINKDITIEALDKVSVRWSGSSVPVPLIQRGSGSSENTIIFKGIDFTIGTGAGGTSTLIGDVTALFLFKNDDGGDKVIFENCSWDFNLGTNSIIPAFVKANQVYFRNGVIDIDTTNVTWTSGYSCSTGIDCEKCHVTHSQVTLYNSNNSNGYDLNFINNCSYAKVDSNNITLSGASRLCRTANSADIVVSHNTIYLKSVTSSISSYDSTKPYHKIFTGNNVYYYRQLHLHFATVTGNTFYNSYGTSSSTSYKIRIYNPTVISANRFYGATSFDFNGYVCVFSGNLLSQALTNTTFPSGSVNANNVTGY